MATSSTTNEEVAPVIANASMRAVVLGVVASMLPQVTARAVLGQENVADPKTAPPAQKTLVERSRKLIADLQRLGPWSEEAKLIRQINRNLFEEYGLNSEEDRFAEKLVSEVARIPPWDFMGRFELAFGMVTERYDLDPEQAAQIKAKVMWRTLRFAGKHALTMFEVSEEFLAARLEGRPFTAAEVARWSQAVEPLLLDSNGQFEALCREIEPLLHQDQRELLARDREAENRRRRLLMAKLGDWQQGKWRPEDWGLHDDPLHKEYFEGREVGAGIDPARADPSGKQPPRYDPADLDAWARYVNDFIRFYRLDEEQKTAARAILRDVRTQAEVHRAALLREAGRSKSSEHWVRTHTRLFEQLKRRLEQIPTDKQARAVRASTQPSVPPGATPPASPVPTATVESPPK
jgi:hypothetical protein